MVRDARRRAPHHEGLRPTSSRGSETSSCGASQSDASRRMQPLGWKLRFHGISHDHPELSNPSAVADGVGATRASDKHGEMVDWRKYDAFCPGPGPFDCSRCFCQRRKSAPRQTATCHRSSPPNGRPALSASPPRPDPQLQRSIQVRRRLIRGGLKGLLKPCGCPVSAHRSGFGGVPTRSRPR